MAKKSSLSDLMSKGEKLQEKEKTVTPAVNSKPSPSSPKKKKEVSSSLSEKKVQVNILMALSMRNDIMTLSRLEKSPLYGNSGTKIVLDALSEYLSKPEIKDFLDKYKKLMEKLN